MAALSYTPYATAVCISSPGGIRTRDLSLERAAS
jgi:hypothetical protein